MNRYIEILESIKYFSKLIGHMHQAALEVNKISDETMEDFVSSKRSGTCAIAVQLGLQRVGAHHVANSDLVDDKIRYTIAANNKINFLLEHSDRDTTFPRDAIEESGFKAMKVFGGGIRVSTLPLVAVSGFHPRIDEACSIIAAVHLFGPDDRLLTTAIKNISKNFRNPYALVIASASGLIKDITPDQATEWIKNEILV